VALRRRAHAALHRRATAALRLAPLPWRVNGCGSGLGARAPWVPAQAPPRTYGAYRMTGPEVDAEARRLRRAGWSPEEIDRVLALTGVPE
jgi:hypothetical protein